MKAAPFRYHYPKTISEAVALLRDHCADDGRILAGGQSLIPTMALRLARPAHLIDINGIEDLTWHAIVDDALVIRAGARHAQLQKVEEGGPLGQILAAVVRHVGHYPIRTRGTFCGSVAHADPAAEWALVTATLGGTIVALSERGSRAIRAEDFFESIMMTALAEDELLVEVRLPLLPRATVFGFDEFSRRFGDYALAMSLVTLVLRDGLMTDVRLGIGGAEARPRRIGAAEAELIGQAPNAATFKRAAEAAAADLEPLEDQQADAAFRRDLVRAVMQRALRQAIPEHR